MLRLTLTGVSKVSKVCPAMRIMCTELTPPQQLVIPTSPPGRGTCRETDTEFVGDLALVT